MQARLGRGAPGRVLAEDLRGQPVAQVRGGGVRGRQVGEELGRRGPALGVTGQAALDQRAEVLGNVVGVRLAVHHAVEQRRGVAAAERALAPRGVDEHAGQAEDIAGRADGEALGLLR